MAVLKEIGEYVGPGERAAGNFLARNLPKNYYILSNIEIRLPSQVAREVDFLIIGEHAVYLADEKSLSGNIDVTQNRWILDSGETRRNPFTTLDALCRHFKGILERKDNRLKQIRVQPVVLMSNPFHCINLPADQIGHVISLVNAAQYFSDKSRINYGIPIPSDILTTIESLLRVYLHPRKARKEIGPYQIIERVDDGPGSVSYLATTGPKDDCNYLVKTFDLTSVPRDVRKERLEREKRLVRGLEPLGIVARVLPPFLWSDDTELVYPMELPVGNTLRAHMAKNSEYWRDFENRKNCFLKLATACNALHETGVIHRNLRPEAIYCSVEKSELSIRITDFDLARGINISTIGPIEADELANPYLPPELKHSLTPATNSSDVFSLAMIAKELLLGEAPDNTTAYSISNLPTADEISNIIEILDLASNDSANNRPATVKDLLTALRNGGVSWANLEPEEKSPQNNFSPAIKGSLEVGSVIEDRYEIQQLLGSGGSASTYKVFDRVGKSDKVIKVIRKLELAEQLSLNEFSRLDELNHSNIVRIYYIQPAEHPWHLLMEFVPGQTLLDLKREAPIEPDRVISIGRQLLDAIDYLEQKECFHRDLSPRNVMVTPNGALKVIDFGLSETPESGLSNAIGTYRYRPPENDKPGNVWGPTGDLYAVAVMLCELLSAEYPFREIPNSDGVVDKGSLTVWLQRQQNKSYVQLANCLARALAEDPNERYQTAKEFLQVFEAAGSEIPDSHLEGTFQVNEWVDKLLRSFRQGRFGNEENRARESSFTKETYVETRLDSTLVPRILAKDFNLILLSGNPGDGKTAFLQALEELLSKHPEAKLLESSPNGWTYQLPDQLIQVNYDASESHKDKSSDEVLFDFFKPFEGSSAPPASFRRTHLVAINDGRLYEFFNKSRTDFPWLSNQIASAQETGVFQDSRLLLINLNERSLVGSYDKDLSTALVERLLDSYLQSSKWEICNQCSAKAECPIKYNVDTLTDPQHSSLVRSRLIDLLRILHLRGNSHMTMRDLRSSLSYIITGIHQCSEIHNFVRQNKAHELLSTVLSQSTFNADNEPDDVLLVLNSQDPGSMANPALDRRIFFSSRRSAELEAMLLPFSQRTRFWREHVLKLAANATTSKEQQDAHSILRRILYFELDPTTPGSFNKQANNLLPFRNFEAFSDLVRTGPGQFLINEITKALCRAVTRSEGIVDPQVLSNGLCVRTEAGATDLIVFKKFPFDRFSAQVGRVLTNPSFCEVLPTHIELIYSDEQTSFSLRISLEMYEFLMRLEEGYVPVPGQAGGFAVDLRQFKNSLLRVQTSELLIFEDGRELHPVIQTDEHKIQLAQIRT